MNFNLNSEQKKHLATLLDNPNSGNEFSYFICSKLLKNDTILIDDFYTDGGQDRGVDFVIIRINNKILSIDEIINKIKEGNANSLTISIFQCKNTTRDTSSLSETESIKFSSFISSVSRFCLDNQIEDSLISNRQLKKFINVLKCIFENQQMIYDINFEYIYINTVLDFDEFQNDKVKNDIGRNIETSLISLYSKAKISYETYSRINLNDLYDKFWCYKKELKELKKYIEEENGTGLVGVVYIKELFKCITNTNHDNVEELIKNYNEIIFDNNVRSFQGKNKVNRAIIESCENLAYGNANRKNVAFWVKNNGITILCDNFEILSNGVLNIYNLKVINGLQTISSIFIFLKEHPDISFDQLDKIKVQIKVIKKEGLDQKEIEDIIIATNSQTQVKYLDLISINDDLKRLEFKLYDNHIDYVRKKKQKEKSNCNIKIKHNELLQLIITCFENGPSAAKNQLESSLYSINTETQEKELLDFKPYWSTDKFNKLYKAIIFYNKLKKQEKIEKDNNVLKYAKLHTTFCAINIINKDIENPSLLEDSIKIMEKVFEYFNNEKVKPSTIEQLSKNISAEKIRSLINEHNLIK